MTPEDDEALRELLSIAVSKRAALTWLERHGGRYLPKFSGLSRAWRDEEIRAGAEAGDTLPELAHEHDLTTRQVRYILTGRPPRKKAA